MARAQLRDYEAIARMRKRLALLEAVAEAARAYDAALRGESGQAIAMAELRKALAALDRSAQADGSSGATGTAELGRQIPDDVNEPVAPLFADCAKCGARYERVYEHICLASREGG